MPNYGETSFTFISFLSTILGRIWKLLNSYIFSIKLKQSTKKVVRSVLHLLERQWNILNTTYTYTHRKNKGWWHNSSLFITFYPSRWFHHYSMFIMLVFLKDSLKEYTKKKKIPRVLKWWNASKYRKKKSVRSLFLF